MNSTARDVLTMIGAGLQRGIIKSPDLEMMYSDGPKRVRLVDMVAHALESLPPAPSSAASEQMPEPPRAPLTTLSAHPALAAAAEYTEKCAAWEQLAFGTRAYYDALAACDAAWERIAVACGVNERCSVCGAEVCAGHPLTDGVPTRDALLAAAVEAEAVLTAMSPPRNARDIPEIVDLLAKLRTAIAGVVASADAQPKGGA